MDYTYAYNFWRKIFIERSEGHFTKDDFDRWFANGGNQDVSSMAYFETIGELGSKEHFQNEMRVAFIEMLQACAEGRFGK